ncbi:MAG: 50S ribosomal protein L37ae [Candidatus Altiarchaeota archaeon]
MYSHTRKVGGMGRYGPRVGRKLRHEAKKVEDDARKSRICPSCSRTRVKRVSKGIWACASCGHTYTGGTHLTSTPRR